MKGRTPAVFGIALWLTACGGGAPGTGAGPGRRAAIQVGTALAAEQVLARTLDAAPSSLDPALVTDTPAQHVLDDLFEGLAILSPEGRTVPGVAQSWQTSADGLTWTFHLRHDARWSNGAPLTAADFVYAWRRTVDPRTAASYAQAVAPVLNAYEIATGRRPVSDLGAEALDAHTLRVRLSEPTPYLPFLMTNAWMFPVYQPAIERYGDGWTRPGNIVSNGAYTLQEHVIGNRLTLDRNPQYWDAQQVHLRRVVYYVLTDRNAQSQRYLAGQVQFVETIPTTDLPWLRRELGDQVVVRPYLGTFYIGINDDQPPFRGNRPLRLALAMALDRDKIATHVLQGAGYPAYTLVPPLEGYQPQLPDWARLPEAQRHALARRLYREAGYSAEHPLRAELSISSGDPVTQLTYEAVCAMWRTVLGAEIGLHPEEFKVLLQNNRLHRNILFHNAWIGDYPDPYTFMQLFKTGFDLNYGGYSRPEYDALLAQAALQTDNAERYRIYQQAERYLNADGAYIPIYYYALRHLVKPYLRGFAPNIVDRNPSRHMYLLEHTGE
ncbi:MAG: peptide ABC transporter substrate-binding protein [Gammaproteobacteria bacterium]|nr:peptide ABC transporter substrate-binding protein [Gammaproteobacteria bacterium]